MATDRIKLNVGGTVFETTRTTILKLNSGYLNKLLDKTSGFEQPLENVWFIDRDPECFRIILNIARYGEVISWCDSINPEMLAREADFYLLGSDVISVILRYAEKQRTKNDKSIELLKGILIVAQQSVRELQLVKESTQDLVRGMASQTYWST